MASSSPARAALLTKLGVTFEAIPADIDETPKPGEGAKTLVTRLAHEKAAKIAKMHPDKLIIAADQVAEFGQQIYGKPHTHANAVRYLKSFSGHALPFYTASCVALQGKFYDLLDTFTVHFRTLSDAQIENYLNYDKPYQCAGSFQIEGRGIMLMERLEGDDFNSLIGLPIIKLFSLFIKLGIESEL